MSATLDPRWDSPSPIAQALAGRDARLTLEQAWRQHRSHGGRMTLGEWRQAFGRLYRER